MKNLFTLNFFLSAAICVNFIMHCNAQTTITIITDSSNCEDAELRNDYPNNNYGNSPNFIANAWSANNVYFIERSLMNIDLTSIPSNAIITNATLSLYCNTTSGHAQLHSSLSGSNQCWIRRITSNWSENYVTWNNQPTTTSQNQVAISQSITQTQDYPNIDVTNLITDIFNNPSSSYGFMISLQTEQYYRSMVFASSDHIDEALRPKLTITYEVIQNNDTCITFNDRNNNIVDAELRNDYPNDNYGNSPNFIANAWTVSGNSFLERSVLKFDLSSIPSNALVSSAKLSLFCNITSGHSQLQSSLSGSNACWLRRITSSWNENLVSWNNQPSTTAQNQVELFQSTSQTQNYPNIDVTTLIQDMINDPNNSFGFMISLETEQKFRCMVFASKDNLDENLRPTLNICYSIPEEIKDNYNLNKDFKTFPNPCYNALNIETYDLNNYFVNIYDVMGNILYKSKFYQKSQIDISHLPQGIYFVNIFNEKLNITKKIQKINDKKN